MQEFIPLAGVIAALSIGVISPGPSFVMVARTAVAGSRALGVAAAIGMGVGGVVFAAAALLGLQAVLHAIPSLYMALKVLGGLYLCYLGFQILRGASQPLLVEGVDRGAGRELTRRFWLGFATQVSNPKTAIVYASVFAAFLPGTFSATFAAALLVAVFVIEAGWYALVALLLSTQKPRSLYLGFKTWLDRAAGAVLIGLGLRLVTTAHTP